MPDDLSKPEYSTAMRTRAVTLLDIALHCGVAKSTVSLALRHDARVAPETTEKILAAASDMGYDPFYYDSARRLSHIRTGQGALNQIIALFFPPHFQQQGFFSELFMGVMDGLMTEGFGLLAFDSRQFKEPNTDAAIWMPFARGYVDGAIFSHGIQWGEELCARLQHQAGFAGRPVVGLLNTLPGAMSVLANNEAGAYASTSHLLQLGHHHLLLCVFPEKDETSHPRLNAIRRALEERGLDPDVHLHLYPINYLPSWVNPATAPKHLMALRHAKRADQVTQDFIGYLRAHPEITAVLGINDACALHVWQAAHLAGLRVPEDLSIVGFDDTDGMANDAGENLLTTVRVPLRAIGQRAAQQIVQQLTGKKRGAKDSILPVELIVRRSTAAAITR